MDSLYTIRVMNRTELDFAVDLAAQEGWNPGLSDADSFFAQDSQGFLIGLLNDEPISCISVVKYESQYAFLGFYIVKSGYRGKDYGYQIWQAGMQTLEGYTVGLDGVMAQVANYEKSGFTFAHENRRYQGGVTHSSGASDSHILPLSQIPLADLLDYDAKCFTLSRPEFLRLWISRSKVVAVGWLENSQLKGYGVARPCREGFKIAPLFADSPAIAESLFASLCQVLPLGATVFLDIPEPNPAALELVLKHQMTEVFKTARMYREGANSMQPPLEKWFGVTSFELG